MERNINNPSYADEAHSNGRKRRAKKLAWHANIQKIDDRDGPKQRAPVL